MLARVGGRHWVSSAVGVQRSLLVPGEWPGSVVSMRHSLAVCEPHGSVFSCIWVF